MFTKHFFILLTLFFAFLVSSINSVDDDYMEKSLYQVTDFVQLLDANNIYSLTNNSEYPWIINFYLHNCGHCRKFSKTFKKLAREVSGWKINIGVINCAINETLETCIEFKTKLYPTIVSIPHQANVSVSDHTNVKFFTKSRSLEELRNLAVDLLIDKIPESAGPQLLDKTMLDQFYSNSNGGNLILAVFGGDESNYLANSIHLDVQECIKIKVVRIPNKLKKNYLQVIGVNTENKASTKKRNSISFGVPSNNKPVDPSSFVKNTNSFVIATRSPNDVLILSENQPTNLTQIRKQLYRNFAYICPNLAAPFLVSTDKEINHKNVDPYTNYDTPKTTVQELHMEDFIGAISISLRFEVSRRDLNKVNTPALIDWLDLVSTCIPFPQKQTIFIHSFIEFINEKSTEIHFDHMNSFLSTEQALDAFPIDPVWKNCAGSDPTYRGFPCSMWLSLHTMLIQCENKGENENRFDAIDVLKIFRNYIDNFFSCSYCRDHFLEMSKDVAKVIKTPVEAIKWAWSSHNRVNARLRKDDSADPIYPKVQFPSKDLCPECHNLNATSKPEDMITTKPGFAVPEQKWNWPAVLMFLRAHYSSENILLSIDQHDSSSKNISVGDVLNNNGHDHYHPNSINANNINFERNVEDVINQYLVAYTFATNFFYIFILVVIVVIVCILPNSPVRRYFFKHGNIISSNNVPNFDFNSGGETKSHISERLSAFKNSLLSKDSRKDKNTKYIV